MGETALISWLVQQAPVIVVMGYFIHVLNIDRKQTVKRLDDANAEKELLAKGVIRVTVLWEEKYKLDTMQSEEIKRFLMQITSVLESQGKSGMSNTEEIKQLLLDINKAVNQQ